ncbi:dihydropteroate synthase [Xylophilus sp. GOD-11R]|uniref:dihydropteroate synthase n=1 Tax=Xylophilus sp. GOD-11R TaxID=3089814 RepID=UPI00298C77F5|nr:dihydropteroate synthase [Xylophilus sp. GOD-11R]WPB58700.1 dihydropteroate synthase [Xylophilus sp. GOD-11R]
MFWQTSRFRIDLREPRVMGIVNVTPDSFSDGGRHDDLTGALRHCEKLLAEGADMLDIGGESTRPGSPPVSLADELARVVPLIREAVKFQVPISVDTYKAEVMRAALDLGADIVNDILALRDPGALEAVQGHSSCGVCLMHMHREPRTMQQLPMEGDVVPQVHDFLQAQVQRLAAAGIAADRVVLDPGYGFGKTVSQNFALLARQQQAVPSGYPILAGWSRKSSLGSVTGLPVDERMVPSVVAAVLAAERGATVLRVHDVADTVAALQVLAATRQQATAG